MKQIQNSLLAMVAGIFVLVSCEINDPIGDIARTGNIAANVYMEVPSANVVAGESVGFHAEYWSVDDQFNALSVGYSVHAIYKYALTAFVTQYTYTLDSTQKAREYQDIAEYQHAESNFDQEKKAYVIDDQFPVSYTLATVAIENADTYNEELINQLFPENAIEEFYEGFFETLDYELMKKLVVTDHAIVDDETFESHWNTETVENPEGGDPIEIKTMKEESIPELTGYVKQVPLEDLVYNPNKLYYGITYVKSFELRSRFRVVNGWEVENFSEEKIITVN